MLYFCNESSYIQTEIICYSSLIVPIVYGLLELFCLYCTVRSILRMKSLRKSSLLMVLYVTCHVILLIRILVSVAIFSIDNSSFLLGMEINIIYFKDIIFLVLTGRLLEAISKDISRSAKDYKELITFIWIIFFFHTAAFFVISILQVTQNKGPPLFFYELGAIILIAALTLFGTITYVKELIKSHPDYSKVSKCFVYLLVVFMNIALVVRIGYYLWHRDSIPVSLPKRYPNDVIEVVFLVFTEFIPIFCLLVCILCEFFDRSLSMMKIGSVLTAVELIESRSYSIIEID